MKKILLFLILILISILLFSCSEKITNNNEDDVSDDISKVITMDFYGYEASIVKADDANTFLMYVENTTFSDAARKRVAEIEENFNCKINILLNTKDTLGIDVYAKVSAGVNPAEIIMTDDGQYGNLGKGGFLTEMDDVRHIIDYMDSAKFGTIGALESIMYNGVIYGVYPNYWPECFPGFYAPIVFNPNLMISATGTDPREFVEQRTWTRSKFEEVLELCTFNDGVKDIYAFAVDPGHFMSTAIAANHINLTRKIDDEYVLEYKSAQALDAIDWGRYLLTEKKHCFAPPQRKLEWWDQYKQSFIEGTVAMLMYPTWGIYGVGETTVGYQVDNFGLLPLPTGPYVEYGDWVGFIEGVAHIMTIPITADDTEKAAHIINALCEPLEGFETEETRMDYYMKHLFHDIRDFNLFFQMVEGSRYNYWKDDGKSLVMRFASLSSRTTTEIIETYGDKFQIEVLEKFVIPNQQFIDSLN